MCATTLSETTFSLIALDLKSKKSVHCNHAQSQYTESNFTDLGYAVCHNTDSHLAKCHNTECHFVECHGTECYFTGLGHAMFHYAECHYAERRGAKHFCINQTFNDAVFYFFFSASSHGDNVIKLFFLTIKIK